MIPILAFRALASERRRRILAWLKDPTRHFPSQVDGDLVNDGVCGLLIEFMSVAGTFLAMSLLLGSFPDRSGQIRRLRARIE